MKQLLINYQLKTLYFPTILYDMQPNFLRFLLFSVNYYGDNFVRASGNVKQVANAQRRLIRFLLFV